MRGYPDYTGVKVNVYLVPDWAAREGTDKNLEASDTDLATAGNLTLTYAVPAGKELYVYGIGASLVAKDAVDRDLPQHCRVRIQKGATDLVEHGGSGGGYVNISKPIYYSAGQTLLVTLTNYANHNCRAYLSAQAYEREV